ncbi:MAG: FAD-dependent oxidoreductase, partial [Xanthomonadaceae bacterium]|nr:FAD-dependent oxidoreductase [Xanthomonadaceae bacterium]
MQRPPRDDDPADVLVVGAGLAGAAAARSLADAGMRVRVLDKGRGP